MDQTQPFDTDLRDTARNAWSFGLLAIVLAMIAPCGSYMTLLAALPLGLVAMSRARLVLAAPNLDPTTEVYARTGQIAGLSAAVWSIVVLVVVGGFVLMYVGMIALVVASGMQ